MVWGGDEGGGGEGGGDSDGGGSDGDGGGGDGDGTAPRCDLPASLRFFHELPDEQVQVV